MSIQSIPVIFDSFPAGYINDVAGWGNFDMLTLGANRGKLLCLDIDRGVTCSNNCPGCFRHGNQVDESGRKPLTEQQLRGAILEAKTMGLRTVKFLGAGEPMEDPGFLDFLAFLHSTDITPAIFSKGHVIGNDALARRIYGMSGEALAARLFELNASILLGLNSFNADVQDAMCGRSGYTEERNRALEILADAGFNSTFPTRLSLGANPVTPANVAEASDIYTFARQRNIYAVTCPTMVSGLAGCDKWREITPSRETMVDLYVKIYRWNIEHGLQTVEQLRQEGISAYAGSHPCNQVATGMYLTLNGTVIRCPGDDVTVFGHYPEQSIAEIWEPCENRLRGLSGCFNCGCPPKEGKSFPHGFFREVAHTLGL